MHEDLLHFIWKTRKIPQNNVTTSSGDQLVIHKPGQHNHTSGPDFFNAKVEIAKQLWAGNVEIHLKSSDWYAHSHEADENYDNVILHVVWDDDVAVFRKDKSEIPTLVLKDLIPDELLSSYKALLNNSKKKFINCESDFGDVDGFLIDNWMHRLYFERLEQKSVLVFQLLEASQNDWEKVLFSMLLKNFGLKVNGGSFLSLANSLEFSTIRKLQNNLTALESILFGMVGFLDSSALSDNYFLQLKKEFDFQANKFKFSSSAVQKPEFFGLRPHNFPTIRLSQLANLYHANQNLFSQIIASKTISDIQSIFKVSASPYWKNHFTFGKESKPSSKLLTKNFIDLLLINTIIPMKFCYAKKMGKTIEDELVDFVTKLKAEKNSIISSFDKIGGKTRNALESQSKIELYNNYCSRNQCLKCAVGFSLLNRNS